MVASSSNVSSWNVLQGFILVQMICSPKTKKLSLFGQVERSLIIYVYSLSLNKTLDSCPG